MAERVPPGCAQMRAMKVDGSILTRLDDVAARSRELEAAGYDGIWSAETSHDPFFPLVLAAEHTERVDLGTSIAVAFARGPMTLANIGTRRSGCRWVCARRMNAEP